MTEEWVMVLAVEVAMEYLPDLCCGLALARIGRFAAIVTS
jgi:hypothetical protein